MEQCQQVWLVAKPSVHQEALTTAAAHL